LNKVVEKELIEVIEKRLANGAARSTVAVTVVYWNALINYASAKGYSVCQKLAKIKGVKGKIRFLSLDEERRILAALHPDMDYPGKRESADKQRHENHDLICMLLDTGARYNEITDLAWTQIDNAKGTITLHRSKGGNDLVCDMTERVKEIMLRRFDKDAAHVFPSKVGKHNSTNWWHAALKRAKISSEPSRPTIHDCRHTFATRLVSKGVGIVEVQHLLGHTSINSTLIYAHFAPSNTTAKATAILNALQQS
jgi:integrase